MSAKRIYAPSVLIDGVEYKCKLRTNPTLEPTGEWVNMCEPEWSFVADLALDYGATESWNVLGALENTTVDVVLKPEDATVAGANPSATFQIRMPPIPFMTGVGRGERQGFPIDVTTESLPVFDDGS